MISDEQFEQISKKLDTLTKLLAGILLSKTESKMQKVEILNELGISTKEIALLAGTTEGSVVTMKKRLKKRTRVGEAKPSGGKPSGQNQS